MKTPSSLGFGYRKSAIGEEGLIVLSAAFSLLPDEPGRIAERMNAVTKKRRESQPTDRPSAGSVFRRPSPDVPVGRLIADAGCAGWTEGGAAVSEKHAGFIVNRGGATESDVRRLTDRVRERVKERIGVDLVPEIEFLSDLPAYPTAKY